MINFCTLAPSEKIEEYEIKRYNTKKLAKFALNAFKVHIGKELEASEFKYDPNFNFKSTGSSDTSKMSSKALFGIIIASVVLF